MGILNVDFFWLKIIDTRLCIGPSPPILVVGLRTELRTNFQVIQELEKKGKHVVEYASGLAFATKHNSHYEELSVSKSTPQEVRDLLAVAVGLVSANKTKNKEFLKDLKQRTKREADRQKQLEKDWKTEKKRLEKELKKAEKTGTKQPPDSPKPNPGQHLVRTSSPPPETKQTPSETKQSPPETKQIPPSETKQTPSGTKQSPPTSSSSLEPKSNHNSFLDLTPKPQSTPPANPSNKTAQQSGPVQKVNSAPLANYELPPNWEEVKTSDGKIYYWNTVTDETTWTRPSNVLIQFFFSIALKFYH